MRRRLPQCVLLIATLMTAILPAWARGKEDAVYVYDLFQEATDCPQLFARLRGLPLRPTVILSIEQGPEFLLDRPGGEDQLTCVLRFLGGTSRQVKALFLQAPGFLQSSGEALRRARLLGEYAAQRPRILAGAQADIEPHADANWETDGADGRRKLLRDLHELLGQLRQQLRGLPLGVAVPWWYLQEARSLPEAAPEALSQVAEELYFMWYGDGKEPVAGDFTRLRGWAAGFPALAKNRRMYLALATYEFSSADHLEAWLKQVRRIFGSRRDFAGTAVFHAGSGYAASASITATSP